MASSVAPAPSTPTTPSLQSRASTPVTGTWRHPRFDEIARRQAASTFTDRNVSRIVWNAGSLLLTWGIPRFLSLSSTLAHLIQPLLSLPTVALALLLLRLLLLYNIASALLPLIRQKDDLTDIPLTPSQRALLGLDPNATPPQTPGAQYITPPRYARSSTPGSGSAIHTPGSRGSSHGSSPLSGRGSPLNGRLMPGGGSPFTPSASPLWQRAIGGGRESPVGRRESYGSPSPLGANPAINNKSMMGTPGTPSPSSGRDASGNGKGVSVPLNSRWLYEKGKGKIFR